MAACIRNVLFDAKHLRISLLSKHWNLNVNVFQKQWQTTDSNSRSEINLNEYSETPEYPECFDNSLEGRRRRRRQGKYDAIRDAPTVEEKYLILVPDNEKERALKIKANVTMGHIIDNPGVLRPRVTVLRPAAIYSHYNTYPLIKFMTRTHFVEEMPSYYENHIDSNLVDAIVEHIKPIVESFIKTAFTNQTLPAEEQGEYVLDKSRAEIMIENIHRMMSSLLHKDYSHLEQCQMDYKPRCDSFWYAGGFPPHEREKKYRKGKKIDSDAPMNYLTQFHAYPHLMIRNDDPLQPFLDVNDALCASGEENCRFGFAPATYGLAKAFRYPSNVPGVFHDDPCGFGTLSYYTREQFILTAKKFGEECIRNAIHAYGISNSFGWLNGLAYNKGFTSFHEITYPISTQTVITNGHVWSFYSYQLNTMSFATDFLDNKFRNVCWGTKELKLFDTVTDGEVKGLNPNVLKILARFYLNSPKKLTGVNMTPYLREVEHTDADWRNIHYKYKRRNSNIAVDNRNLEKTWFTKIYKEWHNTRINKLI